MKEGVVKCKNATFCIDGSGVLYCSFNNKDSALNLDYKTAKQYIDAIVDLCNGKAVSFLIDLRGVKGAFTVAAAKLISKNVALVKLRISEVFLINSIAVSLLVIAYKRIYNPVTPYGVFRELNLAKAYSLESKNMFYGSL